MVIHCHIWRNSENRFRAVEGKTRLWRSSDAVPIKKWESTVCNFFSASPASLHYIPIRSRQLKYQKTFHQKLDRDVFLHGLSERALIHQPLFISSIFIFSACPPCPPFSLPLDTHPAAASSVTSWWKLCTQPKLPNIQFYKSSGSFVSLNVGPLSKDSRYTFIKKIRVIALCWQRSGLG